MNLTETQVNDISRAVAITLLDNDLYEEVKHSLKSVEDYIDDFDIDAVENGSYFNSENFDKIWNTAQYYLKKEMETA